MSVTIDPVDFDVSAEIDRLTRATHEVGAVAVFVGKVRAGSGTDRLASLTLEHYPGMTEKALGEIEALAVKRFSLLASRIIHRVGKLVPGDNIVLVITCAPHRHDALSACDFLMDYLKSEAPFWKKETRCDGVSQWVDARDSDQRALSRWQAGEIALNTATPWPVGRAGKKQNSDD